MPDFPVTASYDTSALEAGRNRAVGALKAVADQADKVEEQLRKTEKAQKGYGTTTGRTEKEVRKLEREVERLRKRLKKLEDQKKKTGKAAGGMLAQFKKLRAGVVGVVASLGLAGLVGGIIQTGRTFEQLEAQLVTVTRSFDAAEEAFGGLTRFAAETPFQVDRITESYIRLKAVGVEPTIELLTSAGDIAAANGRDILDFSEAIVGAVTGEMERLKQFGIVARQQGDEVTFIFQGVETKVKKNARDIVDHLLRLGQTKFAGGMERQAATLSGAISNLGDAWDSLRNSIFESGLGESLAEMTRSLSTGVAAVDEWISKGNDFEKLLDELAPSADGAAVSFRNLADEIQRTAEARELLETIENYNKALRELDKARSQLQALRANPNAAFGALELEKRIKQLETVVAKLPAQIEAARAALGRAQTETARVGTAADFWRARLEDNRKLLQKHEERLKAINEREQERQRLLGLQRDELERMETIRELEQAHIEAGITVENPDVPELPEPDFGDPEIPKAILEFTEDRAKILQEIETRQQAIERVTAEVAKIAKEHLLTEDEHQKLLSKRLQEVNNQHQSWLQSSLQIAGVLAGIDGELSRIVASATAAVAAFNQIGAASSAGGAALGGAQLGSSLSGATGSYGSGQGAQIGSALGGAIGGAVAYAQIGAAAGPWGALVGAAIGLVVGAFIDDMEATAQSYGALVSERGRLIVQVTEAANDQLGRDTERALSSVASAINAIADRFGASAVWTELALQIRETGDGIYKVWSNGILHTFDNLKDATDHAVIQGVKRANFVGLSPIAQAAIDRFAGHTQEELAAVMAAALSVERMNIPESSRQLKSQLDEYMSLLRALPEGAANILGEFGAGGAFQSEYNRLFGIQEDARALRLAEIKALEAEVAIRVVELQSIRAELEAQEAASQVRRGGTRVLLETVDASARALMGFAEVVGGVGGVAVAAAQDMTAAYAAIDGAIAALQNLDFSQGAINAALGRLGRSGGRGGGGGAVEVDNTEALRERLRLLEAEGDQYALNQIELENLIAEMEKSKLTEEERARLIELTTQAQIDAMNAQRDEILDPYREAIEGSGFETQLQNIRDAADEAREALGGTIQNLQDEATIRRGAAAQMHALGQEVLDGLGSQALQTRQEVTNLGGAVQFLRENARELGLDMSDLNQALSEIAHREFATIGGFLAEALGDEEVLADIRKASFLLEFENMKLRFELLQQEGLLAKESIELIQGLIGEVDANLDQILTGFENNLPAPTPGGGAGSGGPSNLETAEALLAQLGQLLNPDPQLDPIGAIDAQAQDLIDQFTLVAGYLTNFGTSIGEVTEQIEEWRLEQINIATEQASQGLLAFYEDLVGGPLSGNTVIEQAEAARARVADLIARANAGDLSARDELAREGQALLGLVGQSFGSGTTAALREQMIAAIGGILGIERPGSGGGGIRPGDLTSDAYRPAENDMIGLLSQIRDALDYGNDERRAMDRKRVRETRELVHELRARRSFVGSVRADAGLGGRVSKKTV